MKRTIFFCLLLSIIKVSYAFGGFHGDFHDFNQRQPAIPDAVEEIDLYEVLQLDEEASSRDIKKAFRRLSVLMHPDKNLDNPDATENFQKLSYAYEILGDEEKKFLYDQGGIAMVKEGEREVPEQGIGIFGALFGGGKQQKTRGEDTHLTLKVDLADLYNGAERSVDHSRRVVCKGCSGRDFKKKEKCKKCSRCPNEKTMVEKQVGPGFFVQQEAEVKSKEKCKQELKELEVQVERGMSSGEKVKFKYLSEQKPKQIPGDVYVTIEQKDHSFFERKGKNLHYKMKITLKEALIGFKKTITHLDGHIVDIDSEDIKRRSRDSSSVFKPFEKAVLKAEGMPVHEFPSQFGDLIITFQIIFPKSLTTAQFESITAIF